MSRADGRHSLLARSFLYSNFSLLRGNRNHDWLERKRWIQTEWKDFLLDGPDGKTKACEASFKQTG